MKKLLFFTSDYRIGLSALLTDQLIALHASGIDVVAVGGEKEQEPGLGDRIARNNVPLMRIDGLDEHSSFLRLVSRVAGIVRHNGIQVVHVQNNWQLAIMMAVKLRSHCKLRIIYTLHGFRHNHPVKSRLAQMVIGSALLFGANRVICMTEYLRRKFAMLSYKIELLPLGVNEDYFSGAFNVPDIGHGLQMVFPAQFRHGKNQDMIIKAFGGHIERTGDSVSHLVLPGSGPLLPSMQALVRELGLSDRVSFPGQQTKRQIKELYLSSNLAIVSSNSETFGQSIVEPYVLGRAVISRPVGIAPEILPSSCLFNDGQELSLLMTGLYANLGRLQDAGQKNYACRGVFRWSEISRRYRQLLK